MTALGTLGRVSANDAPTTPIDYTEILPADLVKSTPKSKLVNPYKDTQADIVAQGGKLFQSYSCSDDDTLFRLVTLGSDDLQKDGYSRKGSENVVGPMPPMGAILKSSDDLWKVLTFVRSKYNGDPAYKFGAPPETN
jgi:hypothetical protein